MKKGNPLPALLRAFFQEWLAEQRSASIHTIRSYRDAWRLLLRFVAGERLRGCATDAHRRLGRRGARVPSSYRAWPQDHDRHAELPTGRHPQLLQLRGGQKSGIHRAVLRGTGCTVEAGAHPAPYYLEPEEVEAILAQPDRSTLEGLRDHVLLSFLYNSGARSRALDLCPGAIRFDAPNFVRLYGKGRKERICPLWPETVALLRKLLERQPRAPDERIFVNRYGEPLGASGCGSSSTPTWNKPRNRR
jgi:site-specific recombinase XerD